MAFEHNDNSGSMFHNERKTKQNHPDRTGSCMVDGKEYWVSGWIKESKKPGGKAWLSLSFTPKEESSRERSKPAAGSQGGFDDMDDDVPF
jgi:hypothetical protein